MDYALRSRCVGKCKQPGHGDAEGNYCRVHRNASEDLNETFEPVLTQRLVLHRVETITVPKSSQFSVITALAKQSVLLKKNRWSWWSWIILLILLSLLAAVFASRSDETRRVITSFMSPVTSTDFLNNTSTVIKRINRVYNYFSPVVSDPVSQSSVYHYETKIGAMEKIFYGVKDRLAALELTMTDLKSQQSLSRVSDSDMEKEIQELRTSYTHLLAKIDQLIVNSKIPGEETSAHQSTIARFMDIVKGIDHSVAGIVEEDQNWRYKIKGLIAANQATQKTLADIHARFETLTKADCRGCDSQTISSDHATADEVKAAITAAIARYDADKTGLADFAQESGGGSIVGVRCTESYSASTRQETLFGVPIWYKEYSPRTVIQSGFSPGECWAFKGSHGYLTIKLSGLIEVTGITYEHIPKSVSPTGNIDSAPKSFELYALSDEKDEVGLRLGGFMYDSNGPPLQYFPVEMTNVPPTNFVELRVLSNQGHPVYTCLYRLRVHGKRIGPAYGNPE